MLLAAHSRRGRELASAVVAVTTVMGASGCSPTPPPPEAPPPSVVVAAPPEEPDEPDGGAEPTSARATTMAACARYALIEDCEDENNQIIVTDARSGYWYSYVDEAGSTITPEAGSRGGTFLPTGGAGNGSVLAARIHGKLAQGSIVYAGMGLNFIDPRDRYDASRYAGITFRARGRNGPTRVRLQVPDANTAPDAGRCNECFNDFGIDFDFTPEWQRYTVRFEELRQQPGWGNPRPERIEPSELYGILWQVLTPGASYDVWVDDIAFLDC